LTLHDWAGIDRPVPGARGPSRRKHEVEGDRNKSTASIIRSTELMADVSRFHARGPRSPGGTGVRLRSTPRQYPADSRFAAKFVFDQPMGDEWRGNAYKVFKDGRATVLCVQKANM